VRNVGFGVAAGVDVEDEYSRKERKIEGKRERGRTSHYFAKGVLAVKYERPVSTVFFFVLTANAGDPPCVSRVKPPARNLHDNWDGTVRGGCWPIASPRGFNEKSRPREMHNRVTGRLKWASRDLADEREGAMMLDASCCS